MITIPANLLLGIFALLFLVLLIMMGAHLYHGYRFGRNDPLTMWVNTAFVAATVGVMVLTVSLLIPINWSESFQLDIPSFNAGPPLQDINLPSVPEDLPSLFPSR